MKITDSIVPDHNLIKVKTNPTEESEFNLVYTPLFSSDQNEIINQDLKPFDQNEFPQVNIN